MLVPPFSSLLLPEGKRKKTRHLSGLLVLLREALCSGAEKWGPGLLLQPSALKPRRFFVVYLAAQLLQVGESFNDHQNETFPEV